MAAERSVLFLTKYARNGASSRYRTFQYLPFLESAGVHCTVSSLFDEAYLVHRYGSGRGRLNDLLHALMRRLRILARARSFDLIVIEYELFPYLPPIFEYWLKRLRVPYLVDYDDAIFHRYDQSRYPLVRSVLGRKIGSVMANAAAVIVGNPYLGQYANAAGARRVEIIPTVIDLCKYPSGAKQLSRGDTFTVGWIGSPSTAKYLQPIAPALAEVCRTGGVTVRLVGSGPVELEGVPVEVLPWEESSEIDWLTSFDVGIMPLPDEPWARGKCGFKLIQYMACGLPVVASPVGANADIVTSENGLLANTTSDWAQALAGLRDNPERRSTLGLAGRNRVADNYCLQVTAPRLLGLIESSGGY